MEKFWWSGEVQADIADSFREAMKIINLELNRLLSSVSFGEKIEQWAFIAIIREEDHPDYGEVIKQSSRGKVLEFRLKIPHADFTSADEAGRIQLVLVALSRSISLMGKLGVKPEVQHTLREVLFCAERNLIS